MLAAGPAPPADESATGAEPPAEEEAAAPAPSDATQAQGSSHQLQQKLKVAQLAVTAVVRLEHETFEQRKEDLLPKQREYSERNESLMEVTRDSQVQATHKECKLEAPADPKTAAKKSGGGSKGCAIS